MSACYLGAGLAIVGMAVSGMFAINAARRVRWHRRHIAAMERHFARKHTHEAVIRDTLAAWVRNDHAAVAIGVAEIDRGFADLARTGDEWGAVQADAPGEWPWSR